VAGTGVDGFVFGVAFAFRVAFAFGVGFAFGAGFFFVVSLIPGMLCPACWADTGAAMPHKTVITADVATMLRNDIV
jgi:hypothetical protein